jgi:hypothetical protein
MRETHPFQQMGFFVLAGVGQTKLAAKKFLKSS